MCLYMKGNKRKQRLNKGERCSWTNLICARINTMYSIMALKSITVVLCVCTYVCDAGNVQSVIAQSGKSKIPDWNPPFSFLFFLLFSQTLPDCYVHVVCLSLWNIHKLMYYYKINKLMYYISLLSCGKRYTCKKQLMQINSWNLSSDLPLAKGSRYPLCVFNWAWDFKIETYIERADSLIKWYHYHYVRKIGDSAWRKIT